MAAGECGGVAGVWWVGTRERTRWTAPHHHTALLSPVSPLMRVSHLLSGQSPPPAPRLGEEEEPEMTAVEKSWEAMAPPEAWAGWRGGEATWRMASSCRNFR